MSFVLVVDDHADTCELMGRLVRRLGGTVECAGSGEQALAIVAARPPALVLLDLSMPKMDGFEVLQQLAALPGGSPAPVVVLSALSDATSRRRALELGASDFWLKADFDLSRFRQLLARYVSIPDDAGADA